MSNNQIIDGVVNEFIGQKRAFTAFEVSLKSKDSGAVGRHRDMKDYIHGCQVLSNELEFGDYEKTLVDVGKGIKAFLYHHSTYDPVNYKPLDRKDEVPVVQSTNSYSPNVIVVDSQKNSGDDYHQLDYRHRLMIPTRFMREAGFSKKEIVNVISNTGCIYLTKNVEQGDYATQQSVERNGDLRLSLGTLAHAGLGGPNFEIVNEDFRNEKSVLIYCVDDQGNRL